MILPLGFNLRGPKILLGGMPPDPPKVNALYSILPKLKILEPRLAARTQFFVLGFVLQGC